MSDSLITKRAVMFHQWLNKNKHIPQCAKALNCLSRVAGKFDSKEDVTVDDYAETLGYIAGYGLVHGFYQEVLDNKEKYFASVLAFVPEVR